MNFVLQLLSLVLAINIANAQISFSDIYSSDPLNESVDYLVGNNVVEGYDDGTFRPLNLINRAEFTKMIVEGVVGETPDATMYHDCFDDVSNEWYAKYVCYAAEQGWVQGYDGINFKPADNITRAEAVKILDEAYSWEWLGTMAWSEFGDNDPGAWYYNYILMAEERGLFDKLDSYISPNELISRRQMAILLYRGMKYEAGEPVAVWERSSEDLSYQDVLDTGLTAAYPSSLDFHPVSQSGWPYACYGFSIKNLMDYKYGIDVSMSDLTDTIGWDGAFMWEPEVFDAFAESYNMDVIFTYYMSADTLLKKLASGEPVVIYMPYYIGEENVGHQVVAYSFDTDGVWVADSLYGSEREISYDDVFLDGANYNINVTELRLVKSGGMYKAGW